MTKNVRAKKKILEELEIVPIIERACQKTGISRATFYRWMKDDNTFRYNVDRAKYEGCSAISDIAESRLIQKVNDGEWKAITYWLEAHERSYLKPRKPVDLYN